MAPYGYKIVRGEALIDSEQALNLRTLFRLYLEGFTIEDAGHDANILKGQTATAKMLSNPIYLGTDFYPRIISDAVFQAAQEERAKRNRHPGNLDLRKLIPVQAASRFRLSALPVLSASPSQRRMPAAELFSAVYDSIEPQQEGFAPECYGITIPPSVAKGIQELFTMTTPPAELGKAYRDERKEETA